MTLSDHLIANYQVQHLSGAVASAGTAVDFAVIDLLASRSMRPNSRGQISTVADPDGASATDLTQYEHVNEGFHEVCVIVVLGTVEASATPQLELYSVTDSAGSNPTLINTPNGGAAQTALAAALTGAEDNTKVIIVDMVRAPGRYVRAKLKRTGGDCSVAGAVVLLGDARRGYVQTHSSVLAQKAAWGN